MMDYLQSSDWSKSDETRQTLLLYGSVGDDYLIKSGDYLIKIGPEFRRNQKHQKKDTFS